MSVRRAPPTTKPSTAKIDRVLRLGQIAISVNPSSSSSFDWGEGRRDLAYQYFNPNALRRENLLLEFLDSTDTQEGYELFFFIVQKHLLNPEYIEEQSEQTVFSIVTYVSELMLKWQKKNGIDERAKNWHNGEGDQVTPSQATILDVFKRLTIMLQSMYSTLLLKAREKEGQLPPVLFQNSPEHVMLIAAQENVRKHTDRMNTVNAKVAAATVADSADVWMDAFFSICGLNPNFDEQVSSSTHRSAAAPPVSRPNRQARNASQGAPSRRLFI